MNPGPQDGRRRQNHGAMVATVPHKFLFVKIIFETSILVRANGKGGEIHH